MGMLSNGLHRNVLTTTEQPLQVREGDVLSVALSPDGKNHPAGYGDFGGGVVLWDAAACKRKAVQPLPVNEGCVGGVAFSADCKTLTDQQ
jgi:hypothetical protein